MKELPHYVNTAGKITVITALLGVVIFAVVFLLNIGANELQQVKAQVATTTVTVLNTPPLWTIDAQETTESSTSTPTNSGSTISWVATATDSNGEDYYLLICDSGSAPTPNAGAAPTCAGGSVQWAVSGAITSGAEATVSTTTTEVAPFDESNDWFAWVCDSVVINPRCNTTSKQGTATTSSPFNVNKRPTFTAFSDNSPTLPGATVTFSSTASDADIVDDPDTVMLIVCSTAVFDTVTDTCDAATLATSTLAASDVSANYVIPIPTQDQNYNAFGFVIDNHGHEATGGSQGTDSTLTVANAAPTVGAAQITLNGGADMPLSVEAGETTGFDLQFVTSDSNSCDAVGGAAADEVTDYVLSVYRSGVGSTTCNGTAGAYNANNCYTSGVATTTWNLSCTPSAASCTFGDDAIDTTMVWDCTFPLWYIADPTDGVDITDTFYFAEDWRAAVTAIDDNLATSTHTESSIGQNVTSFLSMALNTLAIAYEQLEPGDRTDPLIASTTIVATGNVGLDELLTGESMCINYTSAVTCPNSATSTIAESNQVFATSSVTYGFASTSGNILSSSSQAFLDLNVLKTTSTSTPEEGVTFWGINIPATITLAGAYTGENTFFGAMSDPLQW